MSFIIKHPEFLRIERADSIVVDVPRSSFTYWGMDVESETLLAFLMDEESFGNRDEFFICLKRVDLFGKLLKVSV